MQFFMYSIDTNATLKVWRIGSGLSRPFAFHTYVAAGGSLHRREAEHLGEADRDRKWRINSAAEIRWLQHRRSVRSYRHMFFLVVSEVSSTPPPLALCESSGGSPAVFSYQIPRPSAYSEVSRRKPADTVIQRLSVGLLGSHMRPLWRIFGVQCMFDSSLRVSVVCRIVN